MKNVLKKLSVAFFAVIFFALFAVAGFLVSASLFSGFFNPIEVIFGVAGIIICAYISIIVHEGGHMLFGLASGYSFCSFRIGSLMWIKQDGKIKLRRHSIAGTGGQCLMTPPAEKNGKIPVILYNLGGVIANFLLAALFALAYFLSVHRFVLLALIFLFGAIISFAFALSNGYPLHVGGIANDGMNAIHLSKNPDAAIAFRNQLLMNAAQTEGTRLSQMPEEWFTLPEGADMQNVLCASIAVFAINRTLDRGDTVKAEQEITDLLHNGYNVIGLHKNLLTCDLISCRLINNPDANISALITYELKKTMKSMKAFPSIIRTQYIIALLAEKDERKADKIMADFDKLTSKFPYPQEVFAEKDIMAKATEIYKNQQ